MNNAFTQQLMRQINQKSRYIVEQKIEHTIGDSVFPVIIKKINQKGVKYG